MTAELAEASRRDPIDLVRQPESPSVESVVGDNIVTSEEILDEQLIIEGIFDV